MYIYVKDETIMCIMHGQENEPFSVVSLDDQGQSFRHVVRSFYFSFFCRQMEIILSSDLH